jgi:Tol biopolymer transport system component
MNPDWSPDGNSLVFAGVPPSVVTANARNAIHVLDLHTHKVSSLPGSQGFFVPRWSADGRYLSLMPDDFRGVAVYDLREEKVQFLTRDPRAWGAWSHDGRYIYFERRLTEDAVFIFRVHVPKGQL